MYTMSHKREPKTVRKTYQAGSEHLRTVALTEPT